MTVPASPLRGRVRALRAGVLGTTSLGLALGAHLAAGGHRPSLMLLLVCAGLLAVTAATATSARVRLPLLLPLLGVQQVLLHLVFDAGARAAGCGAVDPHLGHAAGPLLSCTPSAAGTAAGATAGWSMVLAHGVATLAISWLLVRGERALWALADRVIRAAAARPTTRRRTIVPLVLATSGVVVGRRLSPAAPRGPPVAVLP
jgi:hypothetical protein